MQLITNTRLSLHGESYAVSNNVNLIDMTLFTRDIIINLYGVYILRNLNSEAQQNIIIKHNREQGRAKVIIRTRDNRRFMVEMQLEINVLSSFRKIAIVSDVFKVMGSSFHTLGAATDKTRLPMLSFVLVTISCEIDVLSCLWIFERCRRL